MDAARLASAEAVSEHRGMDRIFRQQFSLSPASADNVGATDRAPDHFGAEESLDIEHVIYGYFYSKEGSVYAALPFVTIPSYNSAAMQNPWLTIEKRASPGEWPFGSPDFRCLPSDP